MLNRIVWRCAGGVILFLLLGQSGLVWSQQTADSPIVVPVAADTVAIFPTADAYIIDSSPNSNYGSVSSLRVGYDPTLGYMRSLLMFDVAGALPQGAKIDSASLQIYVSGASPSLDPPLLTELYRVDSAWGEGFVRWNNQPEFDSTVQASLGVNRESNFYAWDVTDLVQDWMSGYQTNWGMILIADGSPLQPRSRLLYAREIGGGLFPPRLTIAYSPDSVAPQVVIEQLPSASPESFTVRWCGVDDSDGSGLAHYDVQYRQNGGGWTDWLNNTASTSASFNGSDGIFYEFRVRAVDLAGNMSGYTAASAAGTTAGVPSATMNAISPTITNQTNVAVSWDVVANGETSPGYDIYYWYNDGTPVKFVSNTLATITLFTATHGDGVYSFEAVARNSTGANEPLSGTAEATFILDQSPFTATSTYLPLVLGNFPAACTFG